MSKRMSFLNPALAALLLAVVGLGGCDEPEVLPVDDESELRRYLYESEDGLDLFRATDLFVEQPFVDPFNTLDTLIQVVDSTWRDIETLRIVDYARGNYRYVELLPFPARDAELIVYDFYRIITKRIAGADTTAVDTTQRALTRYAYFVKMGDDSQRFKGWKLYGYNGGESTIDIGSVVYISIRDEGGGTFLGGNDAYERFDVRILDTNSVTQEEVLLDGATYFSYRRVNDIENVTLGDSLILSSDWNKFYSLLVNARTDAGFTLEQMEPMLQPVQSYGFRTASVNPHLWNVIFMQEFLRVRIPQTDPPIYTYKWAGWTIPYRVPQ